jgi:RNA polymerase sigma-70 factor, ECF subfamily
MPVQETSPPLNTRASLFFRLKVDGPSREVAWADFQKLYAPMIAGFARRLGASHADAEDLVQDVLRAFFAASPEFTYDPAKGRFRGYLKTCVWHKLSEMRRARSKEGATASLSSLSSEALADEAAVESVWNDVWETEKLHRALDATRARYATTPDRERTFRAFEMCSLLDRPTAAVAIELGLTEESVRQAKVRVGRALREAYEHLEATTG